MALERIDPDDRDLLLRHESEGVDLATLAHHANVSTGAIAMRLTRARAALRLEFLLAFRRIELPTAPLPPAERPDDFRPLGRSASPLMRGHRCGCAMVSQCRHAAAS